MQSIKTRILPENNYRAVFIDGKTIRQKLDQSKPILPLQYPELEDWAINSLCFANCPQCYVSATKRGENFPNIISKVRELYNGLDDNLKPFQVAIGGAGEPTIHPEFIDFIRTVNELGIMPNYTTNGMHLTSEIIDATAAYCGGVALSYHPHIANVFFRTALTDLQSINTKLNIHVIIGEAGSVDRFWKLYSELTGIDYFVLLPYQAVGRAKTIDVEKEWQSLFESLAKANISNIAFGALFYEYLKEHNIKDIIDVNIYEPEVFSGYRIFDNFYKVLRKSSFNPQPKF